jgi:hypothetical protein
VPFDILADHSVETAVALTARRQLEHAQRPEGRALPVSECVSE